jgi:hypothetical protein
MLAEDGRVFSLNLGSEADPHTQTQETRLVGRDGPQSSLRHSRRHKPARVTSDRTSRSSGLLRGSPRTQCEATTDKTSGIAQEAFDPFS